MSFNKVNNPVSGEDIDMFVGKIEKVFIKKLDTPDRYENTHQASLAVEDGKWISLGGLKIKEDNPVVLRVEHPKNSKKWVNLGDGSEIRLPIIYNGKYINAKRSGIVITSLVEGQGYVPNSQQNSSQTSSGAPTGNSGGNSGGTPAYTKRDNSGMKVGHLRNCVENVLGKAAFDDKDKYIKSAKAFQELTDEVVAKVKELHPKANDYEAGAIGGRAVLSASHNCGAKSFKAVKEYALASVTFDVDDSLKEVVTGEKASKETPKEVPKEAPKETPPPEPQGDDSFDDDIPF